MQHPETMYHLTKLRIAEDQAWAARERLARDARSARFAAHTGESLLERIAGTLRRAGRPAPPPAGGVA
jgi:hypothetical protein